MWLRTSSSISDEAGVLYVALDLTPGPPQFEETEDLTIQVLPFAETLDWMLDGLIPDTVSEAGILRLLAKRPDVPEE